MLSARVPALRETPRGRTPTKGTRPSVSPDKLLKTLAIAVQLALLLFVVERRSLVESPAVHQILRLAAGGFVVHALLPRRFRLPFFVLLSVAGILQVLGLVAGGWVLGLGLALLGICHLPVPFATRVSLLLLVGAALAAARAEWLSAPIPAAVWPVISFVLPSVLQVTSTWPLPTSPPKMFSTTQPEP